MCYLLSITVIYGFSETDSIVYQGIFINMNSFVNVDAKLYIKYILLDYYPFKQINVRNILLLYFQTNGKRDIWINQ